MKESHQSILSDLRRIIRAVNLEGKRVEREYGVSIPQYLCLSYLNERPDYIASMKEIKDAFDGDPMGKARTAPVHVKQAMLLYMSDPIFAAKQCGFMIGGLTFLLLGNEHHSKKDHHLQQEPILHLCIPIALVESNFHLHQP